MSSTFYGVYKNVVGGHMFDSPTILIARDLAEYQSRVNVINKYLKEKDIDINKLPEELLEKIKEVRVPRVCIPYYNVSNPTYICQKNLSFKKGTYTLIKVTSKKNLDRIKTFAIAKFFFKPSFDIKTFNKEVSYLNFKEWKQYEEKYTYRIGLMREKAFRAGINLNSIINLAESRKNLSSKPYYLKFNNSKAFLKTKIDGFVPIDNGLIINPFNYPLRINLELNLTPKKPVLNFKYKKLLKKFLFFNYYGYNTNIYTNNKFFLDYSFLTKYNNEYNNNIVKIIDFNYNHEYKLSQKCTFTSLNFIKRNNFLILLSKNKVRIKLKNLLKLLLKQNFKKITYLEPPLKFDPNSFKDSSKDIEIKIKELLVESRKPYFLGKVTPSQKWINFIYIVKKQYILVKNLYKYIKNRFLKIYSNNIILFNEKLISNNRDLSRFEEFLLLSKPYILNGDSEVFSSKSCSKSTNFLSRISVSLKNPCSRIIINNVNENIPEFFLILESYSRKLEYSELNYSQKILKYILKSFLNKDINFYDKGLTSDSIWALQDDYDKSYSRRKNSFRLKFLCKIEKIKYSFLEKRRDFLDYINYPKDIIILFFCNTEYLRVHSKLMNKTKPYNDKFKKDVYIWTRDYFIWYKKLFRKIILFRVTEQIYFEIRLLIYLFITGIRIMPRRGVIKSGFGFLTYFDFLVCTIETIVYFYLTRLSVFLDKFFWWIGPHIVFWWYNFWVFRNYFLYDFLYALWYFISLYFIFDYLYHRILYYKYYLVAYRKIYVDAQYRWSCAASDIKSRTFAKYVQYNHEHLITFKRWLRWVHYDRPRITYHKFMLVFLNFCLFLLRSFLFPIVYRFTAFLLDEINAFSTPLVKIIEITNQLDDMGWNIYERLKNYLYIKLPDSLIYHWHCYTLEYKGFLKFLIYTPLYIIIMLFQIFFLLINVIILLFPLFFVSLDVILEAYYTYIKELLKLSPYADSKEHFEKFYMPKLFNTVRIEQDKFHDSIVTATGYVPITPKTKLYWDKLPTYSQRRYNRIFYNFRSLRNLKEQQYLRIRFINDAFALKKRFIGKQEQFILTREWLEEKKLPYYVYLLEEHTSNYPNSQFYFKCFGEYGSKISDRQRSNPLELPNRFSSYFYLTSRPYTPRTIYDNLPNYWFDREIDDMLDEEFESSTMDLFDVVKPTAAQYINLKDRPKVHESSYTDLELHEESHWAEITFNTYNRSLHDFLILRVNRIDGLSPYRFYKYTDDYDNTAIRDDEARYIKYRIPEYVNWMAYTEIEETYDAYKFLFKEHDSFERSWIKFQHKLNSRYKITDKINSEIETGLKISNEVKVQLNLLKLKNLKQDLYEKGPEIFDKHFRTMYYDKDRYFFKTTNEALEILKKTYEFDINISSKDDLFKIYSLNFKKIHTSRLELKKHLVEVLDKLIELKSNYLESLAIAQKNNFKDVPLGSSRDKVIQFYEYNRIINIGELDTELVLVKEQLKILEYDLSSSEFALRYEPIVANLKKLLYIKKNNLFKTKDQEIKAIEIVKTFHVIFRRDKLKLIKKFSKIKRLINQDFFFDHSGVKREESYYYHQIYTAHHNGGFVYPKGEHGVYAYENFWDWYVKHACYLDYYSMMMPDGEYYEMEEDEDDEDEEDDEEDWYDETDGIELDWVEDGFDMEDQVEREDLLGDVHDFCHEFYLDKGGFKKPTKKVGNLFCRELDANSIITFFENLQKALITSKNKTDDQLTPFERKIVQGDFLSERGFIDISKVLNFMRRDHKKLFDRLEEERVNIMKAGEFRRPDKFYIPLGYKDRMAANKKYREDALNVELQYAILEKKAKYMKHRKRLAISRSAFLVRKENLYFRKYFSSEYGFLFKLYRRKLRYIDLYHIKPYHIILVKTRAQYPNNPEKIYEVLNELIKKKKKG